MLRVMTNPANTLLMDTLAVGYRQLRPQLATGDLLLFAGKGWSSRLVQALTFSRWSHVGLVVRLPEFGNVPLLWESVRTGGLSDIRLGAPRDGVQLVSLDEKIRSYGGEIAIRRLNHDPGPRERQDSIRRLLGSWHARPYRNILWKHVMAGWYGPDAVDIARAGGFCSEIVAEIYRHWGILPPDRPAYGYVPRDFADNAVFAGSPVLSPLLNLARNP